jgi:hypothetical protein
LRVHVYYDPPPPSYSTTEWDSMTSGQLFLLLCILLRASGGGPIVRKCLVVSVFVAIGFGIVFGAVSLPLFWNEAVWSVQTRRDSILE